MRLTDRRIPIIGGGSGNGLARALWPQNRVAIAGRDEARLDEAGFDPAPDAVRLDVTSEEDAARAIRDLQECMGGLDG
jgi:short-subunit dehydrogenase involved in D-alanine esterification of teichoic acids